MALSRILKLTLFTLIAVPLEGCTRWVLTQPRVKIIYHIKSYTRAFESDDRLLLVFESEHSRNGWKKSSGYIDFPILSSPSVAGTVSLESAITDPIEKGAVEIELRVRNARCTEALWKELRDTSSDSIVLTDVLSKEVCYLKRNANEPGAKFYTIRAPWSYTAGEVEYPYFPVPESALTTVASRAILLPFALTFDVLTVIAAPIEDKKRVLGGID